ncbi:MAG: TlpA family protein disulfide reductase [Maricaulaceae bacterium]
MPSGRKLGIVGLLLIGLASAVYVLFSAGVSPEDHAFDGYLSGEMADFRLTESGSFRPKATVLTAGGEETTVSDIAGDRVALLNLWATWCAPCVVEMPALDALQARFSADDFVVIPINMDRSALDGQAFYQDNGLTNLDFLHDQVFAVIGELRETGRAAGLPISVLYDARGREIGRLNKPADWASEEAAALIEAAISERRIAS